MRRLIFPRRLRRWPVVVALALAAATLGKGTAADAKVAVAALAEATGENGGDAALAGTTGEVGGEMALAGTTGEIGGETALAEATGESEIAEAEFTAEPDKDALGEGERPLIALRSNPAAGRKIALTFDDGPHPSLTEPILDLLADFGAKATFFVIGRNAEAYPEIVAREIAEGHEIGNHTETHPDLSRLDLSSAEREIVASGNAIFSESGYRTRLLRPPCGEATDDVIRLAERLGHTVVLWSVDTRDWAHTGTAQIVRTVREGLTDGGVILFHDFISGESHTLAALGELLPALAAEGYEFVTVSELFGLENTR